MSLQKKLLGITEKGFLVAYKIDKVDSSYSEVLKIALDVILEDEEYGDAMGVFSMAYTIEEFLEPGTYFFVFRFTDFGTEWWTKEILPKTEQEKIDKIKKRKSLYRIAFSFIKNNISTILIIATIVGCTFLLKA